MVDKHPTINKRPVLSGIITIKVTSTISTRRHTRQMGEYNLSEISESHMVELQTLQSM